MHVSIKDADHLLITVSDGCNNTTCTWVPDASIPPPASAAAGAAHNSDNVAGTDASNGVGPWPLPIRFGLNVSGTLSGDVSLHTSCLLTSCELEVRISGSVSGNVNISTAAQALTNYQGAPSPPNFTQGVVAFHASRVHGSVLASTRVLALPTRTSTQGAPYLWPNAGYRPANDSRVSTTHVLDVPIVDGNLAIETLVSIPSNTKIPENPGPEYDSPFSFLSLPPLQISTTNVSGQLKLTAAYESGSFDTQLCLGSQSQTCVYPVYHVLHTCSALQVAGQVSINGCPRTVPSYLTNCRQPQRLGLALSVDLPHLERIQDMNLTCAMAMLPVVTRLDGDMRITTRTSETWLFTPRLAEVGGSAVLWSQFQSIATCFTNPFKRFLNVTSQVGTRILKNFTLMGGSSDDAGYHTHVRDGEQQSANSRHSLASMQCYFGCHARTCLYIAHVAFFAITNLQLS